MRAGPASCLLAAALLPTGAALAALRSSVLQVPAAPYAAQPALTADSHGRVYLSWVEAREQRHALRFALLGEQGFASPQTIAVGEHWFVNWADLPGLRALDDGSLVAWWLQKPADGDAGYAVRLVRSADHGAHWTAPVILPADAAAAEYGFVSVWSWQRDALAVVWLDGRHAQAPSASGAESGMSLRAAVLDADLNTTREWELDTRTCDCCLTDAVATTHGAVVVYRDRSDAEIRDIAVTRWTGLAWTAPQRVRADNWTMAGCPVDGPAAAARGEDVYVAWYTAADERPRLYLARSRDAGATFDTAVTLPSGVTPAGRVDVAVTADGRVWVSWLDEVDGVLQAHLSRYDANLAQAEHLLLGELPAGRGGGIPRLVASGKGVVVAWTDVRAGKPFLQARRVE